MRSTAGSRSGVRGFRFGRPSRRTVETGKCQVRSGTDYPCPRPATREIRGISFCEECAREQEAYALMGDLAQAQGLMTDWMQQAQALRNEPLIEALEQMQDAFTGRISKAKRQLKAMKRETPAAP